MILISAVLDILNKKKPEQLSSGFIFILKFSGKSCID